MHAKLSNHSHILGFSNKKLFLNTSTAQIVWTEFRAILDFVCCIGYYPTAFSIDNQKKTKMGQQTERKPAMFFSHSFIISFIQSFNYFINCLSNFIASCCHYFVMFCHFSSFYLSSKVQYLGVA